MFGSLRGSLNLELLSPGQRQLLGLARVLVHRSRARALAHDARKADASSAMDARVIRRVGV